MKWGGQGKLLKRFLRDNYYDFQNAAAIVIKPAVVELCLVYIPSPFPVTKEQKISAEHALLRVRCREPGKRLPWAKASFHPHSSGLTPPSFRRNSFASFASTAHAEIVAPAGTASRENVARQPDSS